MCKNGPQPKYVRQRPTLPLRHQSSTIGSEGLNFRVRNVTGCFPFDMAAETLLRYQSFPTVSRELHSGRVAFLWSSPRPISTGRLHALLHFHLRPINPVV